MVRTTMINGERMRDTTKPYETTHRMASALEHILDSYQHMAMVFINPQTVVSIQQMKMPANEELVGECLL